MFATVLVANRGEIACRVIRTLRRMGVRAVAVYSDADAGAPHVTLADLAVRIGPAEPARSYLDIAAVVAAAERAGAEAVHPGYGFLSENAAFARACVDAGITFIGPSAAAIASMGDKIAAKSIVEARGVPVVPGVHRPDMSDAELIEAAQGVGYPLLVKAAAGGGGRGMRVVRAAPDLANAIGSARREAAGAFGDDTLLLERYVERPRHIEVQVLADTHGAVIHLGERECSLQRRHQKIVEECPSPFIDDDRRRKMGGAAVSAARACGYVGAGTVEFIAAGDAEAFTFYFLEMNTRLQVEHPVTEEVYGLDLVEWQVRVAAGQPLPFAQDELRPQGHAVEARVYAEDPSRGFLPTGGTVLAYAEPRIAGVRVDSGITTGSVVGSLYDPMLAKVIAAAPDRDTALQRLVTGLADLELVGVTTNAGFLRALLADPDVRAGRLDTGLVERRLGDLTGGGVPTDVLAVAAATPLLKREALPGPVDPFDLPGGWRVGEPAWIARQIRAGDDVVEVRVRGTAAACEVAVGDCPPVPTSMVFDGAHVLATVGGLTRRYGLARTDDVTWLSRDGLAWVLREEDVLTAARTRGTTAQGGPLVAPMPGTVTAVRVTEGQHVAAGETLIVVEAMKMEHAIAAPVDGVVIDLRVSAGDPVAMDAHLVAVTPGRDAAGMHGKG